MFEIYEGKKHVHLVLEYLRGGELFAKLFQKGNYTEADATNLMRTLLETISFCHMKGYIHRDLKLENLILMYKSFKINPFRDGESDIQFKIIDFGLATKLAPNELEIRRCGSPGYVAPEVLFNEGHSFKADVFSCGVILYYLYSCVHIYLIGSLVYPLFQVILLKK